MSRLFFYILGRSIQPTFREAWSRQIGHEFKQFTIDCYSIKKRIIETQLIFTSQQFLWK
jgi:CDP-glycerol glycerophosphotransferase (TagB/SpsB family)